MLKFTHSAKSHIGNVRKANEDAFGESTLANAGHVFVVCDGMGGHNGGEIASRLAVNSILDYLSKANLTTIKKDIQGAIAFANSVVFEESKKDSALLGMGTTAVVLLIHKDSFYIGHAGDSRLYLLSDNQLHQLTKDHSIVQELMDVGQINAEDQKDHPLKNRITRAIGIDSTIEAEVSDRILQVKKNDCFLLCSDGLSNMLNDSEIAKIISSESDIKTRVDELISAALMVDGKDNITACLIEITESSNAETILSNNKSSIQNEQRESSKTNDSFDKVASKKSNWGFLSIVFIAIAIIIYIILFH
jgi:serine/threonine protein phosphatase PrpC